MKKMLLLCGALLAMSASIASAAGVNVAWDACVGDLGTQLRTSLCTANTNTAANSNVLIASFVPAQDIPMFNGAEAFINVATAVAIPAWWGNPCAGKSIVGVGFGSPCANDAYAGFGAGGLAAYNPGTVWDGGFKPNPNGAEIDAAGAVPSGSEQLLVAGTEYFLFTLTISNAKSSGTGNCVGCLEPACINFKELRVTQPAPAPVQATFVGDRQPIAFWQSAVTGACVGATPAHNATWGSIKSLYR